MRWEGRDLATICAEPDRKNIMEKWTDGVVNVSEEDISYSSRGGSVPHSYEDISGVELMLHYCMENINLANAVF